MAKKNIIVVKASGDFEAFDPSKLERSLFKAGAAPDVVADIMKRISKEIYSGMSTQEIYRRSFQLLKKQQRFLAARYSLKKALSQLGPTGFPFEKTVAAALEGQGYKCETDLVIRGRCVLHEVDIKAVNSHQVVLGECKYRNLAGSKVDLKTALYVYARSLDLKENPKNQFDRFWLITNSRFSSEAIEYGNCVGLKMIGWDYPEGDGLRKMIDDSGVHPVTCLTTLTSKQKQDLLKLNIVTCRQLKENMNALNTIRLKRHQMKAVRDELEMLP